jgi:hypothetical protein
MKLRRPRRSLLFTFLRVNHQRAIPQGKASYIMLDVDFTKQRRPTLANWPPRG